MKTEISVDPKTLSAKALFLVEDFKEEKDFKDTLAILSMVAGDYHLDPEVELDELKDFVKKAQEEAQSALEFIIDEEGIDLELVTP
ncbi:MAG: hypothetical protein KC478_10045 [Bacteriovoracaceae bacterium]|nr:hypothetical protein [Bacteriovoracaceae bacterium]